MSAQRRDVTLQFGQIELVVDGNDDGLLALAIKGGAEEMHALETAAGAGGAQHQRVALDRSP